MFEMSNISIEELAKIPDAPKETIREILADDSFGYGEPRYITEWREVLFTEDDLEHNWFAAWFWSVVDEEQAEEMLCGEVFEEEFFIDPNTEC